MRNLSSQSLRAWCLVATLLVVLKGAGTEAFIVSNNQLLHFDTTRRAFLGVVPTDSDFNGDHLQCGPGGFLYGGGRLGLWKVNPTTGAGHEFIHFYTHGSPVTATPIAIAFANNNDGVFIVSNNQLLKFDSNSGAFLGSLHTDSDFNGKGLQFGPDGFLYGEGRMGLWRINPVTGAGKEVVHYFSNRSPVTATPTAVAFGPDGALFIFSNNQLLLFDRPSGSYIGPLHTDNDFYGNDLQLGPDGLLYGEGRQGLWSIDPKTGAGSERVHYYSQGSPVTATPFGLAIVPEPSVTWLFATGVAAAALIRRCVGR